MDEILKALETIKNCCSLQDDCVSGCPMHKFCYRNISNTPENWDLSIFKQGEEMNDK